jgi:hypothetical protein
MIFAAVSDFFIRRLDIGFGNPNKSATLFVMLFAAVWIPPMLACNSKKWMTATWHFALVASFVLGILLLLTGSRGGILAGAAALTSMLWFAPRPWERRKIFVVSVAFVLLIAIAWILPQTARFSPSHAANDASIGNRWLIWKEIPAMILAAPGGWGLGNAGVAFMTWFQAPERHEVYRTLVNSHGTWLVELDWAGRILYLMAWGLALRLSCPDKTQSPRLPSAPFAILLSFVLASAFSSVAEEKVLWVPPGIAVLVATFLRWEKRNWPSWRAIALWSAIPVSLLAGITGLFSVSSGYFIKMEHSGKTAHLMAGEAKMTVFSARNASEHPRSLRAAWVNAEKPFGLIWTTSIEPLKESRGKTIVLLGDFSLTDVKASLDEAKNAVLFSPEFQPSEFSESILGKTTVFFGEFHHDPERVEKWRNKARCKVIPGMSVFIANWAELLFEETS